MHTEKIKMHAVVEDFDEHGNRIFRDEERIEEFTMLHEDRHHIFCNMCWSRDYPECIKSCSVRWKKEKQ